MKLDHIALFTTLILSLASGAPGQTCPGDPPPCGGIRIEPTSGWTATEVSAGSNYWDISITSPGIYYINWDSTIDGDPPAVRLLTITQPTSRAAKMDVFFQTFGGRFARIEEVTVIRDTPENNNGDNDGGSVLLLASLTGDLGPVYGVSWLDVGTTSGEITGPITCISHPLYPTEVYLLSAAGNLTGNVICLLAPEEQDSVPGAIGSLDFANGVIGDPDKPIDIQADAYIQSVYAKNIHAKITGTNTDPDDPELDSFVTQIGGIEARKVGGSGGVFTGEIRAENHLTVDQTFPLATALRFEGEMRGTI